MQEEKVGMIFTQQGVPVQLAADYQKVLDTRWRFLDIELEQEVGFTRAESGSSHYWVQKLCTHNLGYLPAFTYRQISLNTGSLNLLEFTPTIIATKNAIYLRNLFVSGDSTDAIILKAYVRVFACDILKTYQAPKELATPTSKPAYPKSGIKILKNGGNINSEELSDYAINTLGKALAIQQTGLAESNAATSFILTITHGLGYPPTYFLARYETAAEFQQTTVFANPLPGEDYIQAMDVASGANVFADSNQIKIKGSQSILGGKFGFIITKEPVELAI